MVTGVGSYQQAIMNDTLMEELLHEEETETLDFKRDQYLFVGASDDAKSEIVKDVLAFANAWRRTDAYILIGVQEVKGGRSIVHGVTHHLVRLDTFNRYQLVSGQNTNSTSLVPICDALFSFSPNGR
jgi:predicted HTH transcriptional regulator